MSEKIRLTKKERAAIEWLSEFASSLLEGKPVDFEKPTVNYLRVMGIKFDFISHKKVKKLIRGKTAPYEWVITDAPWYIRGKASKQYLPFQIKEKVEPEFKSEIDEIDVEELYRRLSKSENS